MARAESPKETGGLDAIRDRIGTANYQNQRLVGGQPLREDWGNVKAQEVVHRRCGREGRNGVRGGVGDGATRTAVR
jgi:hypothetical protein